MWLIRQISNSQACQETFLDIPNLTWHCFRRRGAWGCPRGLGEGGVRTVKATAAAAVGPRPRRLGGMAFGGYVSKYIQYY